MEQCRYGTCCGVHLVWHVHGNADRHGHGCGRHPQCFSYVHVESGGFIHCHLAGNDLFRERGIEYACRIHLPVIGCWKVCGPVGAHVELAWRQHAIHLLIQCCDVADCCLPRDTPDDAAYHSSDDHAADDAPCGDAACDRDAA